jgi:hypothetical protein
VSDGCWVDGTYIGPVVGEVSGVIGGFVNVRFEMS